MASFVDFSFCFSFFVKERRFVFSFSWVSVSLPVCICNQNCLFADLALVLIILWETFFSPHGLSPWKWNDLVFFRHNSNTNERLQCDGFLFFPWLLFFCCRWLGSPGHRGESCSCSYCTPVVGTGETRRTKWKVWDVLFFPSFLLSCNFFPLVLGFLFWLSIIPKERESYFPPLISKTRKAFSLRKTTNPRKELERVLSCDGKCTIRDGTTLCNMKVAYPLSSAVHPNEKIESPRILLPTGTVHFKPPSPSSSLQYHGTSPYSNLCCGVGF